ncbi:hypothetical protein Taro_014187 [Colocasia esculenta]|uniref:Uncharacterized protein n=1 Tax=Colocasia esculenta TaxID=4460 RepID=A0A843U8E8_COLES|nr:hypothetical protein [Colocasia esculenta]
MVGRRDYVAVTQGVASLSDITDFLDVSHHSAASQCRAATSRRDSPCILMHVGILSRRPAPSRLHFAALRYAATIAAHAGTQARSHEEFSSSSRLKDGKKVPSIISRTEENATVERDTTKRRGWQWRRDLSIIAIVDMQIVMTL